MKLTNRKVLIVAILAPIIGPLFLLQQAYSRPTSLNNIPTADTVEKNTAVVQWWTDMSEEEKPLNFIGLNFSFLENLELGVDANVGPHSEGPPFFHAKYRFDIGEEWPSIAVGIANVSTDEEKNGSEFPYAVASYDFGFLRGHFGFDLQEDNAGFFAGVDKTINILDLPMTFRSDIIQKNDMDDILFSLGLMYELPLNFTAEGWYTWTTVEDKEDSFFFVINYAISF